MSTLNSIYTSQLTDGQLWVGNTGNEPTSTTLTAGSGIAITNGPGIITLSSTGLGSFTWSPSGGGIMAPFNGYIINAGTSFGLPLTTAAVGDMYAITSYGATGGFVINGANIYFAGGSGRGASLTTTAASASIGILCASVSPQAFTVLWTSPNANFVLS